MSKSVQLGEPGSPITPIKEIIIIVNTIVKKELKSTGTKQLNNDILVDAALNIIGKKIKKRISSMMGLWITLTNNKIKDIIKLIMSLENREILLKGTTKNITSREGGFINFLRPLMRAGLPLM